MKSSKREPVFARGIGRLRFESSTGIGGDSTGVFQHVVLKVHKLMCAEPDYLLTVSGTPRTYDVSASLTCQLRYH